MTDAKSRFSSLRHRLRDVLVYAIGQARTVDRIYPGIMHLLIFWGVILQGVGTVIKIWQMGLFLPFNWIWPLFSRNGYLGYELVMDLAGGAILLGVVMAAIRRTLIRPGFMETSWDAVYALILLTAIPVVGFLTEGLRLLSTNPSYAAWSPIGNLTANFLRSAGVQGAAVELLHPYLFWSHVGLGLVFAASIPFTRLRHMLTAPLHIFLKTDRPTGELETIPDLMEAEVLGAETISDFSSLGLISFDACLQCGRCEAVCPATIAGMDYSPRVLLLQLRDNMAESLQSGETGSTDGLYPDLTTESMLWACTTCGACLDVCPAFIRPPEHVVEIRRAQVLMTGEMPQNVGETLRNYERQGNPWGIPPKNRTGWIKDLTVPVIGPGDKVDVLFFVGCAGAFDERNQQVTRSFVQLLQKLRVNYGILGEEELCCGETARRMGNEYLFQTFAEENIALLEEIQFKRIVTLCPHGLNTLRHEYPRFGGHYRVQHAVEFLVEILPQQRLTLESPPSRLTFHDSCYLGRYNNIYTQPRFLLKQLQVEPVEMKESRENSFCCGGGGGGMWLETDPQTRINHHRLEQALEVEAKTITTTCPFCLIMLDDALRSKGMTEEIQVLDLMEILNQAI